MSGWENRAPAELQIGNGTMLVTFDSFGEIEQIFAPNIDAMQSKVGAMRSAVLLSDPARPDSAPQVIALTEDNFEVRLRLLGGSQTFQAEYHHKGSTLRVVRTLGIHPAEPLLLDSWDLGESVNAGVLTQSIPWIGNSTSGHCSLYHPTFNGLVHHRGRRWLGIVARNDVQWVRVGHLGSDERARMWDGERVHAPFGPDDLKGFPAGPVKLGWDQVVQGTATWGGLASGLGMRRSAAGSGATDGTSARRVEFFIACGNSESDLERMLGEVSLIDTQRFFSMSDGMVARRMAPAHDVLDRIRNSRVRALAERSIDVLHALQDAETGALMAAAEVDPHSRVSGGYGFSWPRDGAYLASALGAFGFRERVEHYFRFLQNTQDPSGAWWQRYLATGHAGPSWGRIQIDEPATVIGSAYLHYRRTQDLFWLEKIWPSLEKGLGFLETFHGPEHPLGLPSHDLWEERMGIHAYSLGAVAAAFHAGAFLSGELSRRELQEHYQSLANTLQGVITEKFVTADGPVRRSFVVNSWDYQRGGGHWDETPDVSLLGLITPFAIFKKRDVAALKIIERVRRDLWVKEVGGVLRYPGDHYRGGNPWILTTLWLGQVELSLGNFNEARECFQWAMSKATPHGMLAEQVHRETGRPFWVIPLAWSHAMFLLFVRDVLDRGAEKQIWEEV